jgi:hypothetical protein
MSYLFFVRACRVQTLDHIFPLPENISCAEWLAFKDCLYRSNALLFNAILLERNQYSPRRAEYFKLSHEILSLDIATDNALVELYRAYLLCTVNGD